MSLPSLTSRAHRYAAGGAMPGGPAGASSAAGGPGGAAPGGPAAGPSSGPAMSGAPGAPGAGGDPTAQLQAVAQQYAQTRDPQLAVQGMDMVVQLMGLDAGGSVGGGAGAGADAGMGGSSAGAAPGGPGPQMNRKGGKIPSFGKKAQPGAKPVFGAPKTPAEDFRGKGVTDPGKPMTAEQKLRARREQAQRGGK